MKNALAKAGNNGKGGNPETSQDRGTVVIIPHPRQKGETMDADKRQKLHDITGELGMLEDAINKAQHLLSHVLNDGMLSGSLETHTEYGCYDLKARYDETQAFIDAAHDYVVQIQDTLEKQVGALDRLWLSLKDS